MTYASKNSNAPLSLKDLFAEVRRQGLGEPYSMSWQPGSERRESLTDPLAESCARYRVVADSLNTLRGLRERNTSGRMPEAPVVGEQDIVEAGVIRDYYRQCAMMWALSDTELSAFRKDLVCFLTECVGPTYVWDNNKYEGMIYRLPEFYHYDLRMDELREQHFTASGLEDIQNAAKALMPPTSMLLQPLCYLHRSTRLGPRWEYWFAMNGAPVCIDIEANNPLLYLWHSTFMTALNSSRNMYVWGSATVRRHGSWHYLLLKNWELVPMD